MVGIRDVRVKITASLIDTVRTTSGLGTPPRPYSQGTYSQGTYSQGTYSQGTYSDTEGGYQGYLGSTRGDSTTVVSAASTRASHLSLASLLALSLR